MKKLLYFVAVAVFVTCPQFLYSAEKAEICIKYQKEYGWSKGYAVEGIVISGSDLNASVGSFNRFKVFSTYVVVFWNKNESSLFLLPSTTFGSVPMFETEVEDQKGRKWKIKEGHLFCQ